MSSGMCSRPRVRIEILKFCGSKTSDGFVCVIRGFPLKLTLASVTSHRELLADSFSPCARHESLHPPLQPRRENNRHSF